MLIKLQSYNKNKKSFLINPLVFLFFLNKKRNFSEFEYVHLES